MPLVNPNKNPELVFTGDGMPDQFTDPRLTYEGPTLYERSMKLDGNDFAGFLILVVAMVALISVKAWPKVRKAWSGREQREEKIMAPVEPPAGGEVRWADLTLKTPTPRVLSGPPERDILSYPGALDQVAYAISKARRFWEEQTRISDKKAKLAMAAFMSVGCVAVGFSGFGSSFIAIGLGPLFFIPIMYIDLVRLERRNLGRNIAHENYIMFLEDVYGIDIYYHGSSSFKILETGQIINVNDLTRVYQT